jgi:hypothetical protein
MAYSGSSLSGTRSIVAQRGLQLSGDTSFETKLLYAGSKKCYLGKVVTVYKVKVNSCQVQFFDDPLMPNGGPKTIRFVFKDLRHHPASDSSIPKPQLVPSWGIWVLGVFDQAWCQ